MTTFHLGGLVFSITVPARDQAPRPTLRLRLALWLQHRRTSAELQEVGPRLRRDVGLPPAQSAPYETFALDPRPYWGIDQVPLPRQDRPQRDA